MASTKQENGILNLFEEKKLVKICAPMVRYSKLQFRTLVREYGCDICYTPMIMADSFCLSEKARNNEFTTNLYDSPLVVQFAANTVHDFVGAAYAVSPYCNGVDLNCGCPQRWARQMGLGCKLLEKPQLVADMVKQCYNQIPKTLSISIKLRIQENISKTIEFCRRMEHCGISYLTVHGRTPSNITGPIDAEAIRLLASSVSCPVVANGGVQTLDEAEILQERTNCRGVMVGNGLLTNPGLFSGHNVTPLECVQKWVDICYNTVHSEDTFIKDSNVLLSIPERNFKLTFQCFHHHLVFMLEKLLDKKTRRVFNNFQTFSSVLEFLCEELNVKPNVFSEEKRKMNDTFKCEFNGRDSVYRELLNFSAQSDVRTETDYCSDYQNGKFFKDKCYDSDLSSLFIE